MTKAQIEFDANSLVNKFWREEMNRELLKKGINKSWARKQLVSLPEDCCDIIIQPAEQILEGKLQKGYDQEL